MQAVTSGAAGNTDAGAGHNTTLADVTVAGLAVVGVLVQATVVGGTTSRHAVLGTGHGALDTTVVVASQGSVTVSVFLEAVTSGATRGTNHGAGCTTLADVTVASFAVVGVLVQATVVGGATSRHAVLGTDNFALDTTVTVAGQVSVAVSVLLEAVTGSTTGNADAGAGVTFFTGVTVASQVSVAVSVFVQAVTGSTTGDADAGTGGTTNTAVTVAGQVCVTVSVLLEAVTSGATGNADAGAGVAALTGVTVAGLAVVGECVTICVVASGATGHSVAGADASFTDVASAAQAIVAVVRASGVITSRTSRYPHGRTGPPFTDITITITAAVTIFVQAAVGAGGAVGDTVAGAGCCFSGV